MEKHYCTYFSNEVTGIKTFSTFDLEKWINFFKGGGYWPGLLTLIPDRVYAYSLTLQSTVTY